MARPSRDPLLPMRVSASGEIRYQPTDSDGPCAHIFCDRLAMATLTEDQALLARLGDAWLRAQDRADRDNPRDPVERTAEYALEILRRH